MLVDSACDSEDEVFFGKVTSRELNMIKERFLSHLVPRQLEDPFQSYSDSELEKCDKIVNPNVFTNSSREYECIDWYTDGEFRESSKTHTPVDVIDFELSRGTTSNNTNHKISNKEVPKYQDNGFQAIRPEEEELSSNNSKDQSGRKRPLNNSSPRDLSTEKIRESSSQISLIAKNFLEEIIFLEEIEDDDYLKTSDESRKCNESKTCSIKSYVSRNEVSKRRVSIDIHQELKLSFDKEEVESTLDTVTSREIVEKRSPENTSREDTHGLADDLKSPVIREEPIEKRNIEECVKTLQSIQNVPKTPRNMVNARTGVTSAKTPEKPLREIKVSKPLTPGVSSESKFSHSASIKKKFSHIQSPVAAYIRNQSSQAFRTPSKQPQSSHTFRTPAKRTRDDQLLPTTSQCDATISIAKAPFPKIPKVNYDKVPIICPTHGTVVEKIPKKARNSTPKVIKHTGRLLLIPVVKELQDELEPAELSIVLNRSARFSDTIEVTLENI